MICPNCGNDNDYVIDTRKRKKFIYRKRKCFKCGCRFITHETVIKPCADWAYSDKLSILSVSQLKSWSEALWIETRTYGGSTFFATSIRDFVGDHVNFENGQTRVLGLYGTQWRAWTRKPRNNDLKEWKGNG